MPPLEVHHVAANEEAIAIAWIIAGKPDYANINIVVFMGDIAGTTYWYDSIEASAEPEVYDFGQTLDDQIMSTNLAAAGMVIPDPRQSFEDVAEWLCKVTRELQEVIRTLEASGESDESLLQDRFCQITSCKVYLAGNEQWHEQKWTHRQLLKQQKFIETTNKDFFGKDVGPHAITTFTSN